MFGHCDSYSGQPNQPIDCVNDPLVLAQPSNFSMPYCPHLQHLPVCCDESQYRQFADGFDELSGLLVSCPACYENFKTFLCDLSCGGDQAAFMRPTATARTASNSTVVTAANVTLSMEVAQRLYDSCAHVQEYSAGQPFLQFYGVLNVQQLFTGLIDSPGQSPVNYDWTFVVAGDPTPALSMATLRNPLYACDNSSSNFSCSCGDCPSVCNRCPVAVAVNDSALAVDGHWPAFGHNFLHPTLYPTTLGVAAYTAVLLLAALAAQWTAPLLSLPPHKPATRRVLLAVACVTGAVLAVYALSGVWVLAVQPQEVRVGDEAGMVAALGSWFDPVFLAFLLLSFAASLACLLYFVLRYTRAHPAPFQYHPAAFSPAPSAVQEWDADEAATPLARYATFVAAHPWLVVATGVALTGVCGVGWLWARLQSDPIALWVSPSSQVLQDKRYFDATFGAFYRTEQLILTRADGEPVLTAATLLLLANLTANITALQAAYTSANGSSSLVSLPDLCYRPIPGQGCVTESALEWFNRTGDDDGPPPLDPSHLSDANVTAWVAHCAANPILDLCRGSIGAPTFPYIVLGGYNASDYSSATALIATFPLTNEAADVPRAEAWEAALLSLLQSSPLQATLSQRGLRLDYMLERSVEDEISRGAYKDVGIIGLSYALMFLYISAALSSGSWGAVQAPGVTWPLYTKVGLGLCAILIVLCSLVVSVGVVSAMGVAVTPIISEVIPFLVLAIGVDNVFLLSQAFRRQPLHLSPARRLQLTLREVGVGIALAAASECGAFLLGASTDIPAVQVFALMSAIAIAVDWALQMTVFCAVLVLDARRMEAGRWDLCPCVQNEDVQREVDAFKAARTSQSLSQEVEEEAEEEAQGEEEEEEEEDEEPPPTAAGAAGKVDASSPSLFTSESYLQQFFRRFYLPFLFHPFTRLFVLLFFPSLFFCLLGYGLTHLQLGLDQSTVVPDDSYLQGYFASEAHYLNVGPPVYFVLRNLSLSTPPAPYNYSQYSFQDRVCNAVDHCDDRSLEGLVSAAACTPGSYIAQPASSWMDTYMVWLTSPLCCQFDPANPGILVTDGDCGLNTCVPCVNATGYSAVYGRQRPPPDVFEQWLQPWLRNSSCSSFCAFCSAGVYDSLTFHTEPLANGSTPLVRTVVEASRYMSYHTPLRTQADFIGAIESAHAIGAEIEAAQGLNVFPYSVVYVYFQQYLDLQRVALTNGGLAFLAIFLLSLALLRCLWLGLLQVATIGMVVGDLVGCMALWSIDLNALSVLNLVMAVGISVEFCIHLSTRFLLTAHGSRTERAAHAVYTVGASVVEGITLTKVTGVVVLALATSAVFHVYYFRMYTLIVVLGIAHGVVWLPVLLSVSGSEPQVRGEAGWCGGWMWGWPWERPAGKMEDDAWVVVDDDGDEEGEEADEGADWRPEDEQTSDDEGPDAPIDDSEDEGDSRRSPPIVNVPIDDRRLGLLAEEANSRRVNTGQRRR